MSSVRGNAEVPYSKLDQFGGVGTTPCTIARVFQNLMNRVTTRTAGRGRALSFTSVPVVPAPTGVEYDEEGNLTVRVRPARLVRLAPNAKAVAGGKGKGKSKGMRRVRGMAKAVPKGKAKAKARSMR